MKIRNLLRICTSLLMLVMISAINIPESFSQVSSDLVVFLTATVSASPPDITLHWPVNPAATSYSLYRKRITSATWGGVYATIPGTDSLYSDNNVVIDSLYEYKLIRNSATLSAVGYLYSGINKHFPDQSGKLILIVDSIYMDSLENELYRLMKDISGDGWMISRHNVSETDSVTYIKSLIIQEYNSDPQHVKSVFLFGHVPVPYSGNINPDGHPDHLGAWPADVYYGDMDGIYTDISVNNATASRVENQNIPGDGKFDQSTIPATVKLQVGRVDLSNMPSFPYTEKELLKRYLDKDHNFRNKLITAKSRALVDDNFGYFSGEAFASSGWRSFSPLVGNNNIHEIDFLTNTQDSSYLWLYGCGGGWYQGSSGVATTADFAADTIQTIFTMLFGSYFGDWDSQDNFLRAPLASADRALTCCWSGRPYWYFHPMGMGFNVGYCTQLSQNNVSTYESNYASHWVHIALMGDPSLKMTIVAPPSNISLTNYSYQVQINWNSSPDLTIAGYYVYRSDAEFGYYSRISQLISDSTFADQNPLNGLNWYQVKAVRLETTPSGSYFNTSNAISDSISVVSSIISDHPEQLNVLIYPNPCFGKFKLQFRNIHDRTVKISVTDILGQIILEKETIVSGLVNMDISGSSEGVYYCKITIDHMTSVYKIIKE
ncbi:MAG: T9SS type A sorting domain-containing protein [Bacteroidia bacterium]|nr:T9SS type A sorting domain-containing protein [Bacteroidia bacterium]